MAELRDPAVEVTALYDRNLAEWRRLRSRSLFEKPWLDRFLAGLPRQPGHVLDLGSADGQPIAGHVIGEGHRLTGVDGAPSMIAAARRNFPTARWITADMRGLDLDARFDGILAWCSFFHLPPEDQPAMFATFARHAAPGAMLMFTSGTQWGTALGRFGGETLYHGSLDSAEYRSLLEANGFQVIDHRISDPDCGGLTIWLAKALAGGGPPV